MLISAKPSTHDNTHAVACGRFRLRLQIPDQVLLKDFHGLWRVLRAVHPLRRVAPCISQDGVATRMLSEVGCHVVDLNATG